MPPEKVGVKTRSSTRREAARTATVNTSGTETYARDITNVAEASNADEDSGSAANKAEAKEQEDANDA